MDLFLLLMIFFKHKAVLCLLIVSSAVSSVYKGFDPLPSFPLDNLAVENQREDLHIIYSGGCWLISTFSNVQLTRPGFGVSISNGNNAVILQSIRTLQYQLCNVLLVWCSKPIVRPYLGFYTLQVPHC